MMLHQPIPVPVLDQHDVPIYIIGTYYEPKYLETMILSLLDFIVLLKRNPGLIFKGTRMCPCSLSNCLVIFFCMIYDNGSHAQHDQMYLINSFQYDVLTVIEELFCLKGWWCCSFSLEYIGFVFEVLLKIATKFYWYRS